jgi:hypothetical protein
MDQVRAPTSFIPQQSQPTEFMGFNSNFIIIVLVFIITLQLLGINIFNVFGDILNWFMDVFGPLIKTVLSALGYTAGTVLDETAGAAGTVAKTGIDIAENTLQSAGGILKDASKSGIHFSESDVGDVDDAINKPNKPEIHTTYQPSDTTNPVTRPVASGKAGWCLVGEYEGKRGCVAVGEQDRCLSGQIFPSQVACMNPAQFQDKKQ